MAFAESAVLSSCYAIINSLLKSMDCMSSPIDSLDDLKDGSVLVEIMENFDNAFDIYYERKSNSSFINKWLERQGISLGAERNVDEIFKSGHKSHLTMLCYALATVFLHNCPYLSKKFKSFKLDVTHSELLSITLYTKWQLCDEELEVKEMEIVKAKHKLHVYRNERKTIQMQNDYLMTELTKLKTQITEIQDKSKKTEEEHKVLVARLMAELSHQKYKSMTTSFEFQM